MSRVSGGRIRGPLIYLTLSPASRLRAVSLLLENPRRKSWRTRVTREREAASSARGGRRAKRETAMVSYNDCEALRQFVSVTTPPIF